MSDRSWNRSVLHTLTAAALVVLAGTARADVTPHAGMLRFPDVSADKVCFVYGNDVWVASKAGGVASPLTTPPGGESMPRFSADGKTIVFVGNYDGNRDIYTIPVAGGAPTRVTHHPGAETICDWTPDGKILFFTNGLAGLQRQTQLFTVDATGGMPQKLPVPYAAFGAISPDGTWLAYTPHTADTRTWKRYRGGMATDIWLFNLKDNSAKRITDWEGTDSQAMWVPGGDGRTLYYMSDAGPDHRLNIWKYDVTSGNREQVTKYTEDDVKWPSIGPGSAGKGEIIFQLGSELRLLDLATNRDSVITITIPGDRPTIRPRSVDAAKNIQGGTISPTGKRVAIEARGDIFSAPAKEGVTRNLTRTDGVFERDPAWSPDGKWIAYFSDESGEYELWIRPSDAKPPEEKADDKKDDKKSGEAKKEEPKKDDAKKPEPKPAPRKLTNLGAGFRSDAAWSPDSKSIVFHDQGGRLYLCAVESGETKLIDTDPWSNGPSTSWSSDSGWLAYSLSHHDSAQTSIWLYNMKSGQKTQVTSEFFASGSPAFDRKGEYLYFSSNREVSSPIYSDLDTTFVYTGTQRLYMMPLRADVKSPWLAKSDEEELKKDAAKKDDKKDEKKDEKKEDAKKEGDKPADKSDKPAGEQAAADDGISGSWSGSATGSGENFPPGGVAFTMNLKVSPDGAVTGSITSVMGTGQVSSGTYDKATGQLTISITIGQEHATFTGTMKSGEGSGSWSAGNANGSWTAKRTNSASGGDEKAGEAKKDEPPKEVKIDLDGMERRAIALPIGAGSFGQLAVSDDGKLIYARIPARGAGEPPSIKIFDPKDETKEEKTVTAGAGGFQISADGKKLLVFRGALSVMDAAAGGGKATTVPTTSMTKTIDPRHEWHQILMDTWRLERDYFYEPTMHGVDWAKARDHYMKMLDDCVSREDVAYVQGELISELNIGHAYITSPGDVEQPVAPVNVGLLGCDFELVKDGANSAYKIVKIYEGGPWDADARGPLSQPGIDVKPGEFLLAVNGVPVDTSKDPWAAFIGTADQPTTLTIGKGPIADDKVRDVLVKPIGSEAGLRYRAWVERNREYIDKQTEGKVGYIYVPSTGVDGQNELFRQYFGQRAKPGLIIDDRWNAGGQIPSRFIELLNRPITNYWARRDGRDWPWPPDAAPGAKVMLMNGLAGSGGDCFPWMFRYCKLGKLIGTRTWGGLVGISGNPGLIDGGAISVPTFGFYKNDGTWAVEGHGVDPDLEVLDDPSKMVNGGDPQLDAAIAQAMSEIRDHPYTPPKRPASPNRSGMGIPPADR